MSVARDPRPKLRRPAGALPVALLVEGRRCLVIGGGGVAARKAGALVDAGADVVVVAPRIGEDLEALRPRPRVTIRVRRYRAEDLEDDLFLVITATSDPELNRRILDACHRRGLLCSCPDRGWQDGDFISPASFSHGGVTVSVSTGGVSCRRARLIKESLARHSEALGQTDLLVVGADHRHVDLACLETLHRTAAQREETAGMLRQMLGLQEFMLLYTCNRVELVCFAAVSPALTALCEKILGLDRPEVRGYALRGVNAFRHLVFVAAGLLSQSPRETHIRSQIKEALAHSRREGWSEALLHDMTGRVLRIGRAVRAATEAPGDASDIEAGCEALLSELLGDLSRRRILVIGAGAIGGGVVARLLARGASVSCGCRTRPPRIEASGPGALSLFALDALPAHLGGRDAVVCAAGGTEPILTPTHAHWMNVSGRLPPVIDLGMPRNVAPDFAQGIAGARVFNLDDLKHFRRDDHAGRRLEIGRRVIMEHIEEYERVRASIQTGD